MPKSTGARYTEEFKAEAVQLARSSPERSIRQLAYELSMADQTLLNWIKQAQTDRGEREGLTTQEREELRRLRRENKILREERQILKRALGPSSQMKTGLKVSVFRFIEAERARHSVPLLCRLLGVSRSGYYAWRNRPPSERFRFEAVLLEKIEMIHRNSRATYGAPRVHAELRAIGIRCARKKVGRLMRQAKLRGCLRGRRMRTTHRSSLRQAAPDLVGRNSASGEPDHLWVADVTYVRSRAPLGQRGVQYTSLSFRKRLEDEGLVPSMSRVGSAYDNVLAESFVATLKTELLYGAAGLPGS